MVVLIHYILCVFQLAEGFSVTIVGHTTKGTVWHWLEVTVTTVRGIMLVNFLVAVTLTPNFIGVCWFGDIVPDGVLVNHYYLIYNYIN